MVGVEVGVIAATVVGMSRSVDCRRDVGIGRPAGGKNKDEVLYTLDRHVVNGIPLILDDDDDDAYAGVDVIVGESTHVQRGK